MPVQLTNTFINMAKTIIAKATGGSTLDNFESCDSERGTGAFIVVEGFRSYGG